MFAKNKKQALYVMFAMQMLSDFTTIEKHLYIKFLLPVIYASHY